jgi:hypothetical protein
LDYLCIPTHMQQQSNAIPNALHTSAM